MPKVPQPNQFSASTGQFARAAWVKLSTPHGALVYRRKTGIIEFSEDLTTYWGLSMAVNEPMNPLDVMFETAKRTRVKVNYMSSGHTGERWLMPFFRGYPLITAALTQRDLATIDAGRVTEFEPGTRFGVAYGWIDTERGRRSFADFLCFDPDLFEQTRTNPDTFSNALEEAGYEGVELPWVTPMQIGASSYASVELTDALCTNVPIATSLGREKARKALYEHWREQGYSHEAREFAIAYIEAYCADDPQPQIPLFLVPLWIGPGDPETRTSASGPSSAVVPVRNYFADINATSVRELIPHIANPDVLMHLVHLIEQTDEDGTAIGGAIPWSEEYTRSRIEIAAQNNTREPVSSAVEDDPFSQ